MLLVCLLLLTLLSCTKEAPAPPVLPDEPVILDEVFTDATSLERVPILELESRECDYARLKANRKKRLSAGRFAHTTPAAAPPIPRAKPASADAIIAQGLKAAEITPTADCYVGQGAICHFAFEPGKVYTIPTHPSTASRLYLPPGDRVVTHPLINLCKDEDQEQGKCWEKISGRMGPEGAQQDILAFRPVTTDTPAVTTGVDLESGRSIYFRLVVGKTPMLGVTWDMGPSLKEPSPQIRLASHQQEPPHELPVPCAGTGMRMPVELAQLHTAYTVEPRGPVGFLPSQVFDDGRRTVLKFRLLGGNMPTVFVYKPSGERAVVYFTPYRVPGDPAHGVWYVIDSIWAKIELAGTDGQSVLITRRTDTPAIATYERQGR